MIPLTVSEVAEDSLRRIVGLAALHPPSDLEVRQVIMGCASIMETYVDTVVALLVQRSGVEGIGIGGAMVNELQADFSRNWARRNYWFEEATGLAFNGEKYGQDAILLVDLRNALAHGAGGVSRYQSRDVGRSFELKRKFAKVLYVETTGGKLILSRATGWQAIVIAREFILAVDDSAFTTRRP